MKVIKLNSRTQQLFMVEIAKMQMLQGQVQQIQSQIQRDMMVIAESHHNIIDGEQISLSDDGKRIEIKPSAEKEKR